ncbi:MAG: hypothetical protein ACE5GY_08700, partial [Thermodesulfobacteriota bacterium]
MKLRETGKNDHWLMIGKGDQPVIPQGYIKLSANPLKSTGVFTRYGLNLFAQQVFVRDLPSRVNDIEAELKKNDERCRSILKES